MKKQFSVLVLVLGLVFASVSFSLNVFAKENDMSYKEGQTIYESNSLDELYVKYISEDDIPVLNEDTDKTINPLAEELVKSKTITKFYSNHADIPEFYYYTEHSGGHWYRGYLALVETKKTSGGWNAKFSGKISAFIE